MAVMKATVAVPTSGSALSNGSFNYWTGEANGNGNNVRIVNLDDGNDNWNNATNSNPVAVCLP